ncbi:MAG: hypothetical protein HDR24_09145 [Lachnospiraceae bacterium]|nr:hypothetical protein [Lachnospiraceae bacterium]
MILDNFIGFIVSTYGIQFFMQYLGGKVLDKIPSFLQNNLIEKEKWFEFYEKTLEVLCKKMGWEFDAASVRRELKDEEFVLDDIQDEISTDRILCKLLGKDYDGYYGSDIENQWIKCIIQCIKLPEFDIIYKSFYIDKIDDLQRGQKQILDEIKQIKITHKNMEEEWKRKETDLINEKNISEFKNAMEDVENGDYESAIMKFKKVNCWADDRTKFISYFKIGFCYSQLNDVDRYKKALIWFLKAEKICDYQKDDVVLLFRNIALTYIFIGQKENKIDNYNKSNEYFEKVAIYIKDEEQLYYYETLIHIARNYMDMCDEVSMNEVSEYLQISESIMMFICCCECNLTEEMLYVLVHNMARLFYHKAEKIDAKYMKTAQELYEYVLDMNYVKKNNELLAMSNINTGMSFQYDFNDKMKNAKKAIAFYEIGISLYEADNASKYQYEILNTKLDIASAYETIYCLSVEEKYFEKCMDLTNEIIGKVNYNPQNSLLFRTYILQLYLYIEALKLGQNPDMFIDIDNLRNKLEIISSQINYEKYKYTCQLLFCELDLLLMDDDNCHKIDFIREKILSIQKSSKKGNKNISDVAEGLLVEYEHILDR